MKNSLFFYVYKFLLVVCVTFILVIAYLFHDVLFATNAHKFLPNSNKVYSSIPTNCSNVDDFFCNYNLAFETNFCSNKQTLVKNMSFNIYCAKSCNMCDISTATTPKTPTTTTTTANLIADNCTDLNADFCKYVSRFGTNVCLDETFHVRNVTFSVYCAKTCNNCVLRSIVTFSMQRTPQNSTSLIYTNIIIVQLTNKKAGESEYNVYAESIKNKKAYANKHNFTIFIYETLNHTTHIYWQKFISIQKAFNLSQPNDWIWMVDTDTYITNMNIELNHLTAYATQHDYHIILNRDCNNINGGAILYRNSALMHKFVRDAWNTMGKEVALNDPWLDQRAVIVLANRTEYKEFILWVPQVSLNSYPHQTQCHVERAWRPGDFLIHFAGNHNENLYFKYVNEANTFNREKNTSETLNGFNTRNWLNYINEWRRGVNMTRLF